MFDVGKLHCDDFFNGPCCSGGCLECDGVAGGRDESGGLDKFVAPGYFRVEGDSLKVFNV